MGHIERNIGNLFVAMCPDLCPPRHGDIHISDRSVGSMLSYSCDLGYKLDGPENRTCQTDGTWDKSDPICRSTSGKLSL